MPVVLIAALAVVGYIFYQRLCLRISAISSYAGMDSITRYTPPVVDSIEKDIPEVDVVGAWAMEMAASGIRVTDEEMASQRRMRLEAGL